MPVAGANSMAWQDYVSLYTHELYMGQYRTGWRPAGARAPDNEVDNHLTSELTASWAATNWLSVAGTLLLPYQHTSVSQDYTADGGTPHTTSKFGVGDLYLFANFHLLHGFGSHVMVGPFVKLPTGSTSATDSTGAAADPDFQLGSGSWDYGGQLMAQTLLWGGQLNEYLMFKKDTNGRFPNGDGPGVTLVHNYNWEAMQDLIYSHRLAGSQGSAAVLFWELGLDLGVVGHEIYDGVPSPDAGGAGYLLAAPGLQLYLPRAQVAIEAVVQVPLVQYWSGTQLGYSLETFLGLRYLYE
jgi:hypothetical protein